MLQVTSRKLQYLPPSPLLKEGQCDSIKPQLSTCSAVQTRGMEQPAINSMNVLISGQRRIKHIRVDFEAMMMKNPDKGTTFQGNPTNESHGANAGGKTCL